MAVRDDLKQRMGRFLNLPESRLEDGALLSDLVADSMLLVNMIIELQEELGVRIVQDDLRSVTTVRDLIEVFEAKLGQTRT